MLTYLAVVTHTEKYGERIVQELRNSYATINLDTKIEGIIKEPVSLTESNIYITFQGDKNEASLRRAFKRLPTEKVTLQSVVLQQEPEVSEIVEDDELQKEYDKLKGDYEKLQQQVGVLQQVEVASSELQARYHLLKNDYDNARQEAADIQTKYQVLHEAHARAGGVIEELQREKAGLEEKVGSYAQQHPDVSSPVEGILAYFSTLDHSFNPIFAEEDLQFAQQVLRGDVHNDLLAYCSQQRDEPYTREKLEQLLAFNPQDHEGELEELRGNAAQAEKNLDFKLVAENAPISDDLKTQIISQITGRNYQGVVEKYTLRKQELDQKQGQHEQLEEQRNSYNSFMGIMGFLEDTPQQLEVLFNTINMRELDIYFPFPVTAVEQGLAEQLRQEMEERHFAGRTISLLEHYFLAYRVEADDNLSLNENRALLKRGIEAMIQETPVLLRIAGFSGIDPQNVTSSGLEQDRTEEQPATSADIPEEQQQQEGDLTPLPD